MKMNVAAVLRTMKIGEGNVNAVLARNKFPKMSNPKQTLGNWRARQRIPTDRLLQLMWIDKGEGDQIDWVAYTQRGSKYGNGR